MVLSVEPVRVLSSSEEGTTETAKKARELPSNASTEAA
jgi:hypothetical protein